MKIFDGREYARNHEGNLAFEVRKLGHLEKITPTLAVLLIGESLASQKFIELKKRAGERVGCQIDIYRIPSTKPPLHVIELIKFLNNDKSVHGIMIQLPLPEKLKEHQERFIQTIDPQKDVDGMRSDSPFLSAVVKAIFKILNAMNVSKRKKILVIGSHGEVGKRLLKKLTSDGYNSEGFDKKDPNHGVLKEQSKKAQVIISATGDGGSITSTLINKSVKLIDVGYPKGDFDFDSVSKKAEIITPVPGGVGPVTVISLLENLVEAAYNR